MRMPVGTVQRNRKAKTSDVGTRLACIMAKKAVSLERQEQERVVKSDGGIDQVRPRIRDGHLYRGVPTHYDI